MTTVDNDARAAARVGGYASDPDSPNPSAHAVASPPGPRSAPQLVGWLRIRAGLADAWFPTSTTLRDRPILLALGIVAGAATSLLRMQWPGSLERIWAEDGVVFLGQAEETGLTGTFLTPYAGYMHGVTRLLAAIAAPWPVTAQAPVLITLCVLIVGVLATCVYAVVRDHTGYRLAGVAAALYFVGAPVGLETVNNAANLQWRLMIAAILLLCWRPTGRFAMTVTAVVVFAAALSSPFGVVLVAIAVVRAVLDTKRRSFVVLAAALVGAAVQGVAMVRSPDRPLPNVIPGVPELINRFALRVVGNGVLGEPFQNTLSPIAVQLRLDQALTVAVTAALVIGMARTSVARAARIALPIALSVGLFTLLVGLSAPPFLDVGSARYYLGPAVFLFIGLLVAASPRRSLEKDHRASPDGGDSSGAPHSRRRRSVLDRVRTGVGSLTPAGLIAVAMVAVAVITWQLPPVPPYGSVRPWSEQIDVATRACAVPGTQAAPVQLNPEGWQMTIPCTRLR